MITAVAVLASRHFASPFGQRVDVNLIFLVSLRLVLEVGNLAEPLRVLGVLGDGDHTQMKGEILAPAFDIERDRFFVHKIKKALHRIPRKGLGAERSLLLVRPRRNAKFFYAGIITYPKSFLTLQPPRWTVKLTSWKIIGSGRCRFPWSLRTAPHSHES
jgi:hypothetical protein